MLMGNCLKPSRICFKQFNYLFIKNLNESSTTKFYNSSKLFSLKCFHNGQSIRSKIPTVKPFALVKSLQLRSFSNSFRSQSKHANSHDHKLKSTLYYVAAVGVLVFGLSYAAVPLYRIFCQAYSYGGTVQHDATAEKVTGMIAVKDRKITINFNADTSAMVWNFKPMQRKIEVIPGETALAFYSAKNPTNRPVIGVSTYNVLPFDAGQYFNKIQCFCFEEQMLNPNEEVQMPVFFYIDPEFADDPAMDNVENITLSYTFFEAKPGMEIPLPGFMQQKL